jgi:hypothetical protein
MTKKAGSSWLVSWLKCEKLSHELWETPPLYLTITQKEKVETSS